MRTPFLFLFLILSLNAFSQLNFNYQRDFQTILAKTKNSNDSLYYNKLLTRFEKNDTMSRLEMLALMIGFTAQPAFQPYKELEKEEALFKMNEEGKFKEALTASTAFLASHPLSMKALKEKGFALEKLEMADSAAYYTSLLNKITDAMLSTGNGKSPATARFALGPKDGEFLLRNANTPIATVSSGYDKDGSFLDIVEAKREIGNGVLFYFIIQHAHVKMYEGFTKKEIAKMKKEASKKN